MNKKYNDCLIEYKYSASLNKCWDNYLKLIEARIYELDANETVGHLKAYYFNLNSDHESYIDTFDMFDDSPATSGYFEELFDYNNKKLKKSICDFCKTPQRNPNMLIIDRVIIKPKYRGGFVGLTSIARTIQQFSAGSPIVALTIEPPQFQEDYKKMTNMQFDKLEQDQKKASQKLEKYYEKIGFKRYKKTDVMLMNSHYFKNFKE